MIDIQDITVSYPDKTVGLNAFSLRVENGRCMGIVGANGAGKSTLLLTLCGVLLPEKGRVEIADVVLTKSNLNDVRSRVGMVFQNPDDQLFMPSIYEDVAFGPRNFGKTEDEIGEIVDDALNLCNIAHLKNRSPLRLSGGEKRMAAMAAVLAMRPDVLLLDEPSAFLDPRARRTLITLLKGLPQTKLIATHDLPLAMELCDEVAVLQKGAVLLRGRPEELFYDTQLMEQCGLEAIPACTQEIGRGEQDG